MFEIPNPIITQYMQRSSLKLIVYCKLKLSIMCKILGQNILVKVFEVEDSITIVIISFTLSSFYVRYVAKMLKKLYVRSFSLSSEKLLLSIM